MDDFRIDFGPPLVTDRSARIAESEGIQDKENGRRQDSRKKQRKRLPVEEDTEADQRDKKDRKTGKALDLEA